MDWIEDILVPADACHEPVGRFVLACGEVLSYRCTVEREAFLRELGLDEDGQVVVVE